MGKERTIPTAQNFIVNKFKEKNNCPPTPEQVEDWLIEFAKMHVKEALEITSKKFKNTDNIRAVLKTYPLENID